MSPMTGARLTTGRLVSAVVLALVAVAFLAVGITFCVVPAGSLPGWLGHDVIIAHGRQLPSPGHHPLRAAGSLIAGAVFAVGAWFSLRYKGTAAGTAAPAEQGPEAEARAAR